MNDKVKYEGDLFQVLSRNKTFAIAYEGKKFETVLNYEYVKRPPGVRAIIIRDDHILLNKEYRYELNGWDYRLPGGKVFDSQEEYKTVEDKEIIFKYVEKKLTEELCEEAEIKIKNYKFLEISNCGFTVDWDLYYYLVYDFEELPGFYANDIKKNDFEYIQHRWVDLKTAFNYCLDKKISEERSSNVLIRYLLVNYGKEMLLKDEDRQK